MPNPADDTTLKHCDAIGTRLTVREGALPADLRVVHSERSFPAAGRFWPCSIELEARGGQAAVWATVGKAEGREAADLSRRNLVNLAPRQLPKRGFLVVCEIFPARHASDLRTDVITTRARR
jgi:hypothetical protein